MRTSFFFPPFTGGNKEVQRSKWLSKPGCGCPGQETSSVLGAHLDGMDPTAQDPTPRFSPAAAQPGRDTARWGARRQKPRILNIVGGTQVLKAFFQVGLQSTGVALQPDEYTRNLCHHLSLPCVYGEEPPSLIRKNPDGAKLFPGNQSYVLPVLFCFGSLHISALRRLLDVALPSSDAGATSAPRSPPARSLTPPPWR